MGGVNNGLTLEGLAHRLEALEHENARLRDEVATSRGSDTGRDGVGGVLRTPSAPRADNGAEDGGGKPPKFPKRGWTGDACSKGQRQRQRAS
jgi:hypothetical protein